MERDDAKLDRRLWEVVRDIKNGPVGPLTPEQSEELQRAMGQATLRMLRLGLRRRARLVKMPPD